MLLLTGICLGFQRFLKVLASNHMALITSHLGLAHSGLFTSCKGIWSQLQQALLVFNLAGSGTGFGLGCQVRDVGDVPK